ncbi:MAG: rubredoxin [Methanoregulaceae archaeon]|nr:rubredoxin [Methanoregulaceae archaeon]
MEKYVCMVCGFVYDPQEGDPDTGIPPGTAFTSLPASWHCQVCGSTKEKFTMM